MADAAAADEVLSALRTMGVEVSTIVPIGNTDLVSIAVDARTSIDHVASLLNGSLPVEPNHVLTTHSHLGGLGVLRPQAVDPSKIPTRELKGRGAGVTIGVVDSSFYAPGDAGHPVWAIDGIVFDTVAPVPSTAGVHDVSIGHGNAVVSIIKQLAPQALVFTSTVHTEKGDVAGAMSDCSVAAAIEELLGKHRIHILVLPLGGSTRAGAMPAITRALDPYLASTVVIASAGNNGDDPTVYPASDPDVVGVAAWRSTAVDLGYAKGAAKVVMEPFAGLPKLSLAPWSNGGVCAQLAAPGVRVPTPFLTGSFAIRGGDKNTGDYVTTQNFDGWALFTGTSFAAPIAAGVAAGEVGGTTPTVGDILDSLF
ncbi:MAG: S8/S53 family peptidase [Acidobacteria bacterium]|nr:S8/S53 family peptidase [Acidobacteriota bacterium]